MYGCETGCCGYRLTSEDGAERWTFSHPIESYKGMGTVTDGDLTMFAIEEFDLDPGDEIAIGDWRTCEL